MVIWWLFGWKVVSTLKAYANLGLEQIETGNFVNGNIALDCVRLVIFKISYQYCRLYFVLVRIPNTAGS